ncbi:MAG TPA: uracil-DNA glycosylase [Polyangiaceae bacterium]|nr:uracil-DNA glycosylase [Polyangiaceae bacterium]
MLQREIVRCRACPRLVAWREHVARVKVARYRHCKYWGRPVPGFGDPAARIVLVGLAPGAQGANRTGRMFTGDRSGDFLFAALRRAGVANQAVSRSRDDGLTLSDAYIVAVIRCAPPANRPLPDEILRCARFLDGEIALLPRARVLVALGAIAWRACLIHLSAGRTLIPRPWPRFAHGAVVSAGSRVLLGSYHVSQQNTQTGKLTADMFDAVLSAAKRAAEGLDPSPHS